MADRLLNENSLVDGFLLEDGSGVILMEVYVAPTSVPNALMQMGIGAWLIFICGSLLEYILNQAMK